MDRASFLRKSLMGFSVGIVTPSLIAACSNNTASTNDTEDDSKAGGVYYTAEASGRWTEKVGGHLPQIELEKMDDQNTKVKVVTTHPMKGYEHYIIKHQILDSNFDYIDEKFFDPNTDLDPVSEFILTNYTGPLYALSFCNIHDVWLNQAEV